VKTNRESVMRATPFAIAELDRKVNIPILVGSVGGRTKVTIEPAEAWPVGNEFLGFDHFFYNALAVDEEACGWRVDTGSCVGDGFVA
jgi:hypothetical protein